jgi:hypothetical protein
MSERALGFVEEWISENIHAQTIASTNTQKDAQENVQENDQDDSAGDPQDVAAGDLQDVAAGDPQDNAEGSLQDNAVDDPPVVIDPQARAYASQCLAAAEAEGISSLEIQESIEDLAAFMAAAIQEANERGDPD